ncbi:MAG TPA: hypothetical protein VL084_09135 [Thermoanaerobaculia bacterium]|nr:hypothetical protein [Thermoanaerobaculia bacterium]
MKRALALLALTALATPADAAVPFDAESLRGVTRFHVLVGSVTKDAEELGLSEKVLRTDVEDRFRKAGLPVDSEKVEPHFFILVQVIKVRDGAFVVSTYMEFKQNVRVVVNGAEGPGITWRNLSFSSVSSLERLRRFVSDDLDGFITAFLKANPPSR